MYIAENKLINFELVINNIIEMESENILSRYSMCRPASIVELYPNSNNKG